MKHIFFRILAGIVLLAAIAGIAFFAFNAGVAHGAALDVKTLATQMQEIPRMPMHGYGYHTGFFPHFFMPLGCFGILIPLFLLFLAFGALRHMIWGPRWMMWGHHKMHHHHHGPWGGGENDVPPMFAEWHNRMHNTPPAEEQEKKL